MSNFLVKYNRRTGLLDLEEFRGPDGRGRAFKQRLRAEASRTDQDVEIVVISADSREELAKTHARYFSSPAQIIQRAGQDHEYKATSA